MYHRDMQVPVWITVSGSIGISEWTTGCCTAWIVPVRRMVGGLNRGLIYNRQGILVASTAQEALIRHRPS